MYGPCSNRYLDIFNQLEISLWSWTANQSRKHETRPSFDVVYYESFEFLYLWVPFFPILSLSMLEKKIKLQLLHCISFVKPRPRWCSTSFAAVHYNVVSWWLVGRERKGGEERRRKMLQTHPDHAKEALGRRRRRTERRGERHIPTAEAEGKANETDEGGFFLGGGEGNRSHATTTPHFQHVGEFSKKRFLNDSCLPRI